MLVLHLLIRKVVFSSSHVYILASVVFVKFGHRPFRDIDAHIWVCSTGFNIKGWWHVPLVNVLLIALRGWLRFLFFKIVLRKVLRRTALNRWRLIRKAWMIISLLLRWLHVQILLPEILYVLLLVDYALDTVTCIYGPIFNLLSVHKSFLIQLFNRYRSYLRN